MNQLQQMSPLVLYCLKRDFGGAIDIYKLVSSGTDLKTGKRLVEVNKYHVQRAVIMPVRMSRSQIMLRTSLHNKAFLNLHDEGTREFIIERKDVRQLTAITVDDYIVYNHQKYQLSAIEDYEAGSGWVVTGKVDIGAPAMESKEVAGTNALPLNAASEASQ